MREHYDIQKIIYEIQIYMNDSWNLSIPSREIGNVKLYN